MKNLLVFVLVMVLLVVSISPALAGNGNGEGGGRGNGQDRIGNTSNQQRLGTGGNRYGWQYGSNVITGVIAKIDGKADSGMVKLTIFGGKEISLYGEIVEIMTDSSTRFLSKNNGEITAIAFGDLAIGDAASIAIGSDGIADRITIGVECPKIP